MAEIIAAIVPLSWPILLAWVVWKFSAPISALIGRIKSVTGPAGFSADFIENKQQIIKHKSLEEYLKEATPTPYEGEVLAYINREIQDDIAKLKIALTLTYIASDFERLHNFSFGTQIQFLNQLNLDRSANYLDYFEKHKTLVQDIPNVFPTPEIWLKFLLSNTLITPFESGYGVTIKGQEFLAFLSRNYPNAANKAF